MSNKGLLSYTKRLGLLGTSIHLYSAFRNTLSEIPLVDTKDSVHFSLSLLFNQRSTSTDGSLGNRIHLSTYVEWSVSGNEIHLKLSDDVERVYTLTGNIYVNPYDSTYIQTSGTTYILVGEDYTEYYLSPYHSYFMTIRYPDGRMVSGAKLGNVLRYSTLQSSLEITFTEERITSIRRKLDEDILERVSFTYSNTQLSRITYYRGDQETFHLDLSYTTDSFYLEDSVWGDWIRVVEIGSITYFRQRLGSGSERTIYQIEYQGNTTRVYNEYGRYVDYFFDDDGKLRYTKMDTKIYTKEIYDGYRINEVCYPVKTEEEYQNCITGSYILSGIELQAIPTEFPLFDTEGYQLSGSGSLSYHLNTIGNKESRYTLFCFVKRTSGSISLGVTLNGETKTIYSTTYHQEEYLAMNVCIPDGSSTVSGMDIQYVCTDFIGMVSKIYLIDGIFGGITEYQGIYPHIIYTDSDRTILNYQNERLSSLENQSVITEITYDSSNRTHMVTRNIEDSYTVTDEYGYVGGNPSGSKTTSGTEKSFQFIGYDTNGRVNEISDAKKEILYSYDSYGDFFQTRRTIGPHSYENTIYIRNNDGNIIEIQKNNNTRSLSYTPDRKLSTVSEAGHTIEYTYTQEGRRFIRYSDGHLLDSCAYTESGEISILSYGESAKTFRYTLDKLTSVLENIPISLAYDSYDRLSEMEKGTDRRSYAYTKDDYIHSITERGQEFLYSYTRKHELCMKSSLLDNERSYTLYYQDKKNRRLYTINGRGVSGFYAPLRTSYMTIDGSYPIGRDEISGRADSNFIMDSSRNSPVCNMRQSISYRVSLESMGTVSLWINEEDYMGELLVIGNLMRISLTPSHTLSLRIQATTIPTLAVLESQTNTKIGISYHMTTSSIQGCLFIGNLGRVFSVPLRRPVPLSDKIELIGGEYTCYGLSHSPDYCLDGDSFLCMNEPRVDIKIMEYSPLGNLQAEYYGSGGDFNKKEYFYQQETVQGETYITSYVSQECYIGDDEITAYTYQYELENVSEIRRNMVLTHQYTYSESRIISETQGGATRSYTYDEKENLLGNGTHEMSYGSLARIRLEAVDQTSVEYNSYFYPSVLATARLTYQDHRLSRYQDSSGTTDYEYGVDGLRIRKTTNGTTTSFYYENGILRLLKKGSIKMEFLYDILNTIYGFIYQNNIYYYRRDFLGTITGILNSDFEEVVSYAYTAYGIPLGVSGNTTLGNLNPIRYKGYYYDIESGYYYCKARYYVPEIGRFLTPDDSSYLNPYTQAGINPYAYCNNNPVMGMDPTGHFAITLTTLLIGAGIGAVIGASIGVGVTAYNDIKDGKWDTHWSTYLGAAFGGAIAGVGTGIAGVLGAGIGAAMLAGESLTMFGASISGITAFGIGVGVSSVSAGAGYSFNAAISKDLDWNVNQFGKEILVGALNGSLSFIGGFVGGYTGTRVPGSAVPLKTFATRLLIEQEFTAPTKILLSLLKNI